ncbi:hypothetical protein [Salinigranum halophilum]|nr:hypothetical protein [Salinigranum halophilum]
MHQLINLRYRKVDRLRTLLNAHPDGSEAEFMDKPHPPRANPPG